TEDGTERRRARVIDNEIIVVQIELAVVKEAQRVNTTDGGAGAVGSDRRDSADAQIIFVEVGRAEIRGRADVRVADDGCDGPPADRALKILDARPEEMALAGDVSKEDRGAVGAHGDAAGAGVDVAIEGRGASAGDEDTAGVGDGAEDVGLAAAE